MEPKQGERRRYHRYPVALDVEIRDGEHAGIAGRIRDLCLGGVLLGSADREWVRQVQTGMALDLVISLPVAGDVDRLSVSAQVVRVFEDTLGLRFEKLDKTTQASLQRFIAERFESAASSSPGTGAAGPARERAATILQRITRQRSEEILDAWLQAVEDALWNSVDHAQNDIERSRRSGHAVRFGRLRRQGALGLLAESVQQRRPDDHEGAPEITDARVDDLALVDKESFETWLERSSLVAHLEDDLEDYLKALKSQATTAFGSDETLDFLPAHLARSFEAWVDAEELESDVKRIGLNEGRRVLPRLLGGYYRDLSRALEAAGFVPLVSEAESARNIRVRPSRPAGEMRRDTTGGGALQDEVGAVQEQVAHHPAAATRTATTSAPQAAVPQGELTSARVAELLMMLPYDALGDEALNGTGRSLKEQAVELLRESQPDIAAQSLEPVLHERIDATDRVLKHMMAGTGTSSRIRQWVNQLSLRVLTAAIADPDFFRHPGHPLMQLLGQLDHIAMVLPDEGAGGGYVAEEIDRLVNEALSVDVRDTAAFGPILDRMGMLEQQYGERFRQDAERAIERLEGRDRRARARRYVQQELARRIGGTRIHRVVDEFINEAWATLLELRFLREGEDGQQLQRDWEVLSRVQALCGEEQPRAVAGDEGIDTLEAEILSGLSYVGFDPYLAKSTMRKVREAVRKQLAGLGSPEDFITFQPAAEAEATVSSLEGIGPEMSDGLSRQIDALHLGARVRLREGGNERALRMIWRSPDESEFAFLDVNDGQVRPFTRDSLAAGLHDGKLRMQSWLDGGLADRALDATLRELQEHIHYHETRDALTGLFTRQQFNGHLVEMLSRAVQSELHVLAFLEIDHFEAINSNCGYMAAEQLLQLVSRLLQERLGDETFLAFLGSQRFGFMLQAADAEATKALCESVRRDVYGLPFRWEGKAYPVTASVGMVLVQAGERNPDVLLSSLELACTTAREAGGNRLVVFSEDDDSITHNKERLHWLSTVEDVVKSERIRLRVQTIAPINPGEGLHAHHEVLLRVYDEQGEELDLEQFIATAEAFHVMGEVDRLVIRKALAWGQDNPSLLKGLGGMAINLSGVSLSDPQLLAYIRSQLDHFGVPPEYISFELTETAAIASLERALGIIEGIKDIGCRVALDDFGTGMASYSYLKTLPVDFVKIDGSFIKDVLTNSHDLAIVKAINEIAHFMGIKTIAEYVANEEIIGKLDEIGVDYMQGYAVQRPRFLEELKLLH